MSPAERLTVGEYHHNISYDNAASALKHGILSLQEEYRLRGREMTLEEKIKFSREGGHINGIDEISLASMNIDFDNLYSGERIYDPASPYYVDILIADIIKTYRITEHYANEFLARDKIPTDFFLAIDVRILKYLEECDAGKKAVSHYNYLLDIISIMIEQKLDIPVREMSENPMTLSKVKMLTLPKIKLI